MQKPKKNRNSMRQRRLVRVGWSSRAPAGGNLRRGSFFRLGDPLGDEGEFEDVLPGPIRVDAPGSDVTPRRF